MQLASDARPIIWAVGDDSSQYVEAEAMTTYGGGMPLYNTFSNSNVMEASVDNSFNPNYSVNSVNNSAAMEFTFIPETSIYSDVFSSTKSSRIGNITPHSELSGYIPPKLSKLSKTVVIFENERYSPIIGWSVKGLLPTDRKAISTASGDVGWSNLEEASNMIVSHGWRWLPGSTWEIDSSFSNDPSGWKFSSDFASFKVCESGSHQKYMGAFVRRRAYFRTVSYDVNYIYNDDALTCEHCDLQDVDLLSKLLLDCFVSASEVKYPSQLRVDKIAKLKNGVIEATGLLAHTYDQYYYKNIVRMLDNYLAATKKAAGRKSTMFTSSSPPVSHAVRLGEAEVCFSADERRYIARHIIRRFDTNNVFHCNQMYCGAGCRFAAYRCPHSGCAVRYSAKWRDAHENECPFKIIPCSRSCGEHVCRSQLAAHLANICILRLVPCTYQHIGCTRPVIFRDLQDHMHNSSHAHLALAMDCLSSAQRLAADRQTDINRLQMQLNQRR